MFNIIARSHTHTHIRRGLAWCVCVPILTMQLLTSISYHCVRGSWMCPKCCVQHLYKHTQSYFHSIAWVIHCRVRRWTYRQCSSTWLSLYPSWNTSIYTNFISYYFHRIATDHFFFINIIVGIYRFFWYFVFALFCFVPFRGHDEQQWTT